MKKQNDLIKCFRELYEEPSYTKMAKLLNVQKTRVFRVCNGHEMKLSEYLKMQELVDIKNKRNEMDLLVSECVSKLSQESLEDIKKICKRKLAYYDLLNTPVEVMVSAKFAA